MQLLVISAPLAVANSHLVWCWICRRHRRPQSAAMMPSRSGMGVAALVGLKYVSPGVDFVPSSLM